MTNDELREFGKAADRLGAWMNEERGRDFTMRLSGDGNLVVHAHSEDHSLGYWWEGPVSRISEVMKEVSSDGEGVK